MKQLTDQELREIKSSLQCISDDGHLTERLMK
jgi:hypothetical protein